MSTALAVHHGPFGRVALYNLDRSMVPHAHREGHLIFHVRGRATRIRVGDADLPLDEGAAVAVNPWQIHNFRPGDPGQEALFLVLYIQPHWFLEASRQPSAALHFGRNRIELTETIARKVMRVAGCLLDDAGDSLIEGHLGELTQSCFDQSWQWVPQGAGLIPFAPAVRDFRVRNSVRLMRDAIGERVALDRIARQSGLSRPHFYKLFREQLGITPNIYLNTLRMEHAIAQLVGTDDAVTEIGLDLGFSSQASFTRFFIANVGVAPSAYRRVAHHTAAG